MIEILFKYEFQLENFNIAAASLNRNFISCFLQSTIIPNSFINGISCTNKNTYLIIKKVETFIEIELTIKLLYARPNVPPWLLSLLA